MTSFEIIRTPEQKEAHKAYRASLKREEIREGIHSILFNCLLTDFTTQGATDDIVSYLHSQRVVIEVDKELPICITYSKPGPVTIEQALITPNIKRMIKALNLVEVEPLIEEGK